MTKDCPTKEPKIKDLQIKKIKNGISPNINA